MIPSEIQKFLNEHTVADLKLFDLFKSNVIGEEDYQLIRSTLSNISYILVQSFCYAEKYITLLEKNNFTQELNAEQSVTIEHLCSIRTKVLEKLRKYEPDLAVDYVL